MRNGEFGNGIFCNKLCAREGGRDDTDGLDELDCNNTDNNTGGDCEPNIERIRNDESVNEGRRDRIGGDGKNTEFFDAEAKNAKYDTGGNR